MFKILMYLDVLLIFISFICGCVMTGITGSFTVLHISMAVFFIMVLLGAYCAARAEGKTETDE